MPANASAGYVLRRGISDSSLFGPARRLQHSWGGESTHFMILGFAWSAEVADERESPDVKNRNPALLGIRSK